MIGRVVGNFQFLELLGEGGIGAVYAGIDRLLGRPVAIKVLRPELAHDTRFVDRFRSEAASLARLNHPNITTLYTLHMEGQELLMIIELVEGRTLEDILQVSGKLSAQECVALAAQATDGFAYAHRMGVVHRDIKPANLMVTGDGSLKIMDFGIARIRGSQRMTRTGHIIGTLAYMAPEQIQGHEGDERSDIYSLGIVLYELLAGNPPFTADSEYQLIRAQVEETPRALVERLPGIDPSIDGAVMRALAKDPAERFATMPEFAVALGSTMGLATAKETMVRRVAPLVSQLAATRQRPMVTDPTLGVAASSPPSGVGTALAAPSVASPSQQWSEPESVAAPAPPRPAAESAGKRRLSVPVLVLGAVVLLFVVGIGFVLKDTFFAARTPPQVANPAEEPKDVPPPANAGVGTREPEPPEAPSTAITSTENPGEPPATSPPPVLPTPSTPITGQPTSPSEPAPFAPVAPAIPGPAIGSITPKEPVETVPEPPTKSEKKTKKATNPPPKKTPSVARSDDRGSRPPKTRTQPPAQQGSSGWIIRRE